jgi:antitoxin component of MazEF toxin-antitoxin module
MVKLQRVVRSNGSELYSVNLPLELVEMLAWQKGDELEISEQKSQIIIKKV